VSYGTQISQTTDRIVGVDHMASLTEVIEYRGRQPHRFVADMLQQLAELAVPRCSPLLDRPTPGDLLKIEIRIERLNPNP